MWLLFKTFLLRLKQSEVSKFLSERTFFFWLLTQFGLYYSFSVRVREFPKTLIPSKVQKLQDQNLKAEL